MAVDESAPDTKNFKKILSSITNLKSILILLVMAINMDAFKRFLEGKIKERKQERTLQ